MQRILCSLILFVSAAVAGAQESAGVAPAAAAASAHLLNRAEFEALIAHPEHLLLIDVRRPDEVTNVGGFPVYLSVQAGALESAIAWIPHDRRIVTVSNHAGRAGKAADLLRARGFDVIGAIGVETYAKEGGVVTHIVPPATPQH